MPPTELELLRDQTVVRVIRVAADPIHIGRDLGNTVVVMDDDVSAHHAVIARRPDGLFVGDVHSTNGTFVNDIPIQGDSQLADGDVVRFGASCMIRVRQLDDSPGLPVVLEDMTAGTIEVLANERIRIGSGEDDHIRLACGPRRAATLTLHPNGDLWIGDPSGARSLGPGEEFEVAGHRFRVGAPESRRVMNTLPERVRARYPYALRAVVAGPGGAVAMLRNLEDGSSVEVTAENRAMLLYVLARQLCDDRRGGRLEDEAGWCHDEDVLVAVWGRASMHQAPSNYSVLLHRLRKDVEEAGFDPWFIEKRRGATRIRVAEVEVV